MVFSKSLGWISHVARGWWHPDGYWAFLCQVLVKLSYGPVVRVVTISVRSEFFDFREYGVS